MDKKQLTKLVSFFVLGDGHLELHGRNARLRLGHSEQNNDYLLWKQSVMEELTSVSRYFRIKQQEQHSQNIVLSSKTHPFYTTLWTRLYNNNRKTIDPHTLKLLDWEALAILIQDDGSTSYAKSGMLTNLYIHTNAFTYGDNLMLKKALEENLGLMFNVVFHKPSWYELRLRNKDYPKLYQGCLPYLFKSFEYKLRVPTKTSEKSDDDIVCTTQECVEFDGNNQTLLIAE